MSDSSQREGKDSCLRKKKKKKKEKRQIQLAYGKEKSGCFKSGRHTHTHKKITQKHHNQRQFSSITCHNFTSTLGDENVNKCFRVCDKSFLGSSLAPRLKYCLMMSRRRRRSRRRKRRWENSVEINARTRTWRITRTSPVSNRSSK